jgi:hypothetical protein
MRFQERDSQILLAIFRYGGVLAFRHLHLKFWPGKTERAVLARLAKLVNHDFLSRPTADQRRTQPIPEPIYWLGWKGIIWVAGQIGVRVDSPANTGENQMRKLAKRLRDQGVRWLREPRWLQLAHDLAVVDFRLQVEQAVRELPALSLDEWLHEGEFRSDGDTIAYQVTGADGKMRRGKKRVYPDSYFVIVDTQRATQGQMHRARLLLELDKSTHPTTRFARDKVAPGLAYIKSPAYKARFGDNSGRWLVVTTGRIRMRNLMRQTQQVVGTDARIFLFTIFDQLKTGNVLTEPIWWQAGMGEPIALMTTHKVCYGG